MSLPHAVLFDEFGEAPSEPLSPFTFMLVHGRADAFLHGFLPSRSAAEMRSEHTADICWMQIH